MNKKLLQSIVQWRKGVLTDQMTKQNFFYILDPESGLVFEADLLAADFCSRVDGRKTVQSILEKMARDHKLETRQIEEEAVELILGLKKNKLAELKSAKAKPRSKSGIPRKRAPK